MTICLLSCGTPGGFGANQIPSIIMKILLSINKYESIRRWLKKWGNCVLWISVKYWKLSLILFLQIIKSCRLLIALLFKNNPFVKPLITIWDIGDNSEKRMFQRLNKRQMAHYFLKLHDVNIQSYRKVTLLYVLRLSCKTG